MITIIRKMATLQLESKSIFDVTCSLMQVRVGIKKYF